MRLILISALDALNDARDDLAAGRSPHDALDEAASELRAALRSCDAEEAQ